MVENMSTVRYDGFIHSAFLYHRDSFPDHPSRERAEFIFSCPVISPGNRVSFTFSNTDHRGVKFSVIYYTMGAVQTSQFCVTSNSPWYVRGKHGQRAVSVHFPNDGVTFHTGADYGLACDSHASYRVDTRFITTFIDYDSLEQSIDVSNINISDLNIPVCVDAVLPSNIVELMGRGCPSYPVPAYGWHAFERAVGSRVELYEAGYVPTLLDSRTRLQQLYEEAPASSDTLLKLAKNRNWGALDALLYGGREPNDIRFTPNSFSDTSKVADVFEHVQLGNGIISGNRVPPFKLFVFDGLPKSVGPEPFFIRMCESIPHEFFFPYTIVYDDSFTLMKDYRPNLRVRVNGSYLYVLKLTRSNLVSLIHSVDAASPYFTNSASTIFDFFPAKCDPRLSEGAFYRVSSISYVIAVCVVLGIPLTVDPTNPSTSYVWGLFGSLHPVPLMIPSIETAPVGFKEMHPCTDPLPICVPNNASRFAVDDIYAAYLTLFASVHNYSIHTGVKLLVTFTGAEFRRSDGSSVTGPDTLFRDLTEPGALIFKSDGATNSLGNVTIHQGLLPSPSMYLNFVRGRFPCKSDGGVYDHIDVAIIDFDERIDFPNADFENGNVLNVAILMCAINHFSLNGTDKGYPSKDLSDSILSALVSSGVFVSRHVDLSVAVRESLPIRLKAYRLPKDPKAVREFSGPSSGPVLHPNGIRTMSPGKTCFLVLGKNCTLGIFFP
jgi:hypothetical protein